MLANEQSLKITILGTGRVAQWLVNAIQNTPHQIDAVYGRQAVKVNALCQNTNATPLLTISDIPENSDLYLLAVKDDAIASLVEEIPAISGLVAHTSGSTSIDLLARFNRCGIFYPLQTFSSNIALKHSQFPVLIETKHEPDEKILTQLAADLACKPMMMDSRKRSIVHLAAVFASNFTNHCIGIASNIMAAEQLDDKMLQPLIKEMVFKLDTLSPQEAQTGPAMRNDQHTIAKHLQMLDGDHDAKALYAMISDQIIKTQQLKNDQ